MSTEELKATRSTGSWDLSQDNIFYRPQIQLDCRMLHGLVAERLFSSAPLVVGDVGVGLGFDRLWDVFADQCLQIGFDADKEECAQLERDRAACAAEGQTPVVIENIALWETVGTQTLYVTEDSNAASFLVPNQQFFDRLPDKSAMQVTRTVAVNTTTLDRYHEKTGREFDVLKLDVQGGELSILKGGQKQLSNSVLAIMVEVEFVELYAGQPLFAEVDQFLRGKAFNLFDLDIRRWRRRPLSPSFDGLRVGQTVWADALYLRDPVEHKEMPWDHQTKRIKLLKLACLAEYFSLADYAIEILEFSKENSLISQAELEKLVGLLTVNQIIVKRDRTVHQLGSSDNAAI